MQPTPNVSAKARALAHMPRQPEAPASTLTTADLRTFAAQCLARMRADGDRLLDEARANAGQQKALTIASRISRLFDDVDRFGLLALLATRHDDTEASFAIEADMAITHRQLVDQAHAARTISIPRCAS